MIAPGKVPGTPPGTVAWLARHEFRLFWRDAISLLTAGRSKRALWVIIAAVIFFCLLHGLAFSIIGPLAKAGFVVDKQLLVATTAGILLSLTTMISQAMDSVTRAFYSRGDLDLILSSPVSPRRVFTVRILAIALATMILTMATAGPFINALAFFDGAGWLAAYGVIIALGALSTGFALVLAIGLFRSVGPKLTRAISQVVAAVIGATFVIGVQVAAILSIGSYARFAFLSSKPILAMAPGPTSLVWLPALAVMGDMRAFVLIFVIGLGTLALVIYLSAAGFGNHVIVASGLAETKGKRHRAKIRFRPGAPKWALRRKEWMVLIRDPWLMSESLMQILYLVPPALLLWLNFSESIGSLLILVPIMVMAAGQLSGGLAWLAVSGEDAPELVASAPVSGRTIIAAKIESVMAAIALVFAPLLVGLALAAPKLALVAALGIFVSALSGSMIQIWFRAQATRRRFRSRQTSSKVATLAEALSSISWAGTAALAAIGTWMAIGPALVAVITLTAARAMSPSRSLTDTVQT